MRQILISIPGFRQREFLFFLFIKDLFDEVVFVVAGLDVVDFLLFSRLRRPLADVRRFFCDACLRRFRLDWLSLGSLLRGLRIRSRLID